MAHPRYCCLIGVRRVGGVGEGEVGGWGMENCKEANREAMKGRERRQCVITYIQDCLSLGLRVLGLGCTECVK